MQLAGRNERLAARVDADAEAAAGALHALSAGFDSKLAVASRQAEDAVLAASAVATGAVRGTFVDLYSTAIS